MAIAMAYGFSLQHEWLSTTTTRQQGGEYKGGFGVLTRQKNLGPGNSTSSRPVDLTAPSLRRIPTDNATDTTINSQVTTNTITTGSSNRHLDFPVVEWDAEQRAYRIPLKVDQPNDNDGRSLCVPWHVDGDLWWTHHRDWEMGRENDTYYCFQMVRDPIKQQFFLELYQIQFGSGRSTSSGTAPEEFSSGEAVTTNPCAKLSIKDMWSSGWGADMMNVVDALQYAMQTGHPVQINESMPWHYAITKRQVDKSKPVQSACPAQNMYCYLLNMTKCSSKDGNTHSVQELAANQPWTDIQKLYAQDTHRYRWFIEYLVRPQTWLRKRVYDFLQKHGPNTLRTPCTVMHVRRNDVVLHSQNMARKFHPIQEYVSKAKTKKLNPNILLLTDDHNAIGEAKSQFPEYHWMYIDRARFHGVGAWEHQIPSDDPALEVVVLFAIFELVRHCDQIVLSSGKFSDYLYEEMKRNRPDGFVVDKMNIDDGDPEIFSGANSSTHGISKNYEPAAPNLLGEKRLTSGGVRMVGELLSPTKEFNGSFCLSWNVDADDWFSHHPTWEVGMENTTHYCFHPILDGHKAAFLEDLYRVQFLEGDCHKVVTKPMLSLGWGADIKQLAHGLAHAKATRVPFQVGTEHWNYARQTSSSTSPTESIMACPKGNLFCYFLDVSRCQPGTSGEGGWLESPLQGTREYPWLLQYLTRPQTWLRKKVVDFVATQEKKSFTSPCAVLHVPRGDGVLVGGNHTRKHHTLQEYMDYALHTKNVTVHKNILLLTDEAHVITEAKSAFPNYNWMYIDRPRKTFDKAQGEQHLASNDPLFEVVVIQSIFRMAKRCNQLIHASSEFAELVWVEMTESAANHRHTTTNHTMTRINIDEGKAEKAIYNSRPFRTRNEKVPTHFVPGGKR